MDRLRLEKRLCGECNADETEVHCLCQCKKYETHRKIMYDNVNNNLISYSDPYITFLKFIDNP